MSVIILLKILLLLFAFGCGWVWFLGFSAIGNDIQRENDAEFKRLHPNWDGQRKTIHQIEKEYRRATGRL